jgi:MFS family permease
VDGFRKSSSGMLKRINYSVAYLPQIFAPAVAGVMVDFLGPVGDDLNIDHFGYKAVYFLSGILLIIAVILIFLVDLPPPNKDRAATGSASSTDRTTSATPTPAEESSATTSSPAESEKDDGPLTP